MNDVTKCKCLPTAQPIKVYSSKILTIQQGESYYFSFLENPCALHNVFREKRQVSKPYWCLPKISNGTIVRNCCRVRILEECKSKAFDSTISFYPLTCSRHIPFISHRDVGTLAKLNPRLANRKICQSIILICHVWAGYDVRRHLLWEWVNRRWSIGELLKTNKLTSQ